VRRHGDGGVDAAGRHGARVSPRHAQWHRPCKRRLRSGFAVPILNTRRSLSHETSLRPGLDRRFAFDSQRRLALRAAGAALAASGLLSLPAIAQQNTIKVGILHSLSGTMAISETVLKDVALMAIEEINAKGGVLGKKLEPVVVDPASNWPLFAEKARQLISQDKVAVMFGCWTSVSRKSVLPVVEELNGLLFYPVQYEGEELSKNVFYTGAAPNQQAIPAVEYLMSKDGGGAKRFVLLGTDYVYPRTTNKILRAFLKSKGVKDSDIDEKYTPFGHSDYQTIVADVKKFAAGGKTAVISTINGDSNVPFYKELGNQGLKATDVPVVAFSVGEEELRGVDTKPLVGHLAAWNYFMSIKNPANDAFKKQWADYAKAKKLPGADKPLTNDPMEATYIGIHMWKQAVEKAKSTDTDKVIAAMAGQTFQAPGGFTSTMDAKNHHLHKPVFIGEVKADGQFNVVWKTPGPVKAKPWSPYIDGNDKKKDEPEKK
jgi:urea transport system substrate-binding protein